MKIYAEKGHSLTEGERLEIGRLLLKAGYFVRMGKDKPGSTARPFIEFYSKVEFGQEKAAPSGNDTESGGMGNQSTHKVTQERGDVNAGAC